ncbi:hypothetical protein TKK_0016382 [Trichogramma kaykai]|uniref:Uncharacterized protein n=1 Tax=Trichogramma kaykai TaxID=54128 RepID=A0ABD2W6P3_9HYME
MDILKSTSKSIKIESPFTWDLDLEQVCNFHEEEIDLSHCEESPILRLIEMNTLAYIRCIQMKFVAAEELIGEIDDVWKKICKSVSEQRYYSVDVLAHIKDATAFYIYSMIGKKEQTRALEIKIKDAKNFISDIQKGTLFGSQAIASSLFFEKSASRSFELAKSASSYVPNCALWHYLTAKCLRKKRRYQDFCLIVSNEEETEFLKCYELSPSDHYGICVARMYKESKNWKKSSEICNEIYLKNPNDVRVRLLLALFFITQKDFIKAKDCLDYVGKLLSPEKTPKTYYHYLAKYYEGTNDYPKAKENYLKAAGGTGNFPADMDYLNLIRNTSQSKFDYEIIKHLKSMLNKYEDNQNLVTHILLNLAVIYLFDAKNYKLAADYFLKAIKTNPCDPQLENFQTRIISKKHYNIYELIRKNILTINKNNYGNALKDLKNYCTEYKKRTAKTNVPDSLEIKFAEKLSLEK